MTKATHYLQLLEDARCQGNWDEVPELVRKVRKHAPNRACLTLTAEIECSIEKNTRTPAPATRPATSASAKDLEVSSQLPKLLLAIEAEDTYQEDRFQARVCVGWLHWVVGEYNLASVRLPRGFESEPGLAEGESSALSEWTRVCHIKAAYLIANCLARNGNKLEALQVFRNGIPELSTRWSFHESRSQLRYWSELFLTEYCMLFSHSLEKGECTLDEPGCLASFRSWARWWEMSKDVPIAGGFGFRGSVPRRQIWGQYYSALSAIVERDLPFPTGYVAPESTGPSARSQLRAELKKVEATYEALLLNETEFPRADEEREEIEEFVRLAAQNWTVLCGRGWRGPDLGPGGREAMSRGVLEILYRASMKTYHSTAILRNLFLVHAALAEFDLALKAFDSYFELVKKGKARVQKTGHHEPSLDAESTVLETVSSCIAILCRYGHRTAAERAKDLAVELEDFVNKAPYAPLGQSDVVSPLREDQSAVSAVGEMVPPRVIALSWQAVGVAHAQWARVTYDSASRAEVQAKAIKCLKKSLSADLGASGDVRSVFALGTLLAEQRELSAAIELAKTALLHGKPVSGSSPGDVYHGLFWRQRSLIPIWHLLSLLLSARQDFVLAARACEGAFEQFQDPAVLFGSQNVFRSEHLNEASASRTDLEDESGMGLVDEMDDFEKEGILEVKMTQLALVELLEGPKVAVNASLELLSLYTRLFGSVQAKVTLTLAPPETAQVPKSSAGTIRSIFGSRSQRGRRPVTQQTTMLSDNRPTTTASLRPQTTQTVASSRAPTIQITYENGDASDRHSRKSATYSDRRRSQSGKRQSLRKRDSSLSGAGGRRRASSLGPLPNQDIQQPTIVDGESYFTPLGGDTGPSIDFFASPGKRSPSAGPPVSMSRTFSQAESFASSTRNHSEVAAAGGGAIEYNPRLLPLVQFPQAHEQRRRGVILVRVWLMIAGFYRRAALYDDAKAAVAEAQRLVQGLEAEVAKDPGASLGDAGWANSKSVEEMWGDVWAEMGNLDVAKGVPYSARESFESALTHFPNHPAAIVGLSNILLDIYSEKLAPPPTIPGLNLNSDGSIGSTPATDSTRDVPIVDQMEMAPNPDAVARVDEPSPLPWQPLGLGATYDTKKPKTQGDIFSPGSGAAGYTSSSASDSEQDRLMAPYKASSLPKGDRLAARDRAQTLLSGLTKLGSAWNLSEAWFALARAHEESGQLDRAKEVLWWCVELEEAAGVRDWTCLGSGRYVL